MMPNKISKLALGTANFGQLYGIANRAGKLETKDLVEILQIAAQSGIDTIDTAQAYGLSEQRLGDLNCSRFNVITKIDLRLDGSIGKGCVETAVYESLCRLSIDRLSAVLIHHPEILLGPFGRVVIDELNTLKEMGLVEKVGISIYSPTILDNISKLMKLDVVQVPFNIFDQRISKSGWNNRLEANGTEIHVRSAFLQGALLMSKNDLPKYFDQFWKGHFEKWFQLQEDTGYKAYELALRFCLQQSWIDKIVVGVDSAKQLEKLVNCEAGGCCDFLPAFTNDDPYLIDPSLWNFK